MMTNIINTANTPAVKRVRRKSTVSTSSAVDTASSASPVVSIKNLNSVISAFNDLSDKITQARSEFESLQKEVNQMRDLWVKEQRDRQLHVQEMQQQEEIKRQREQETYAYETNLARKKAEDEFAEKKLRWEKELAERKEEIENDKRELGELRKEVAGFEEEKEKAVKEACSALQKELTEKFDTEKKLREQEIRSEKEILTLKIESLSADNARQAKEIEMLKKALDEATRQVKDIAVKVIESNSPPAKTSPAE